MTSPIETLQANIDDVAQLFALHVKHGGKGPGRKYGVEVLNKSAIVLATACWEAFVEDVALTGASHLSRRLGAADALPKEVQKSICAQLKQEKHELAPWTLAGKGWRQVLETYVRSLVDRFNTPKADNVDRLLECALGLRGVSSRWSWGGMNSTKATSKLDRLVTLRGSIAHRVSAGGAIHKVRAQDDTIFIMRLAAQTSNVVREHLKKLTRKSPWDFVTLKKTNA